MRGVKAERSPLKAQGLPIFLSLCVAVHEGGGGSRAGATAGFLLTFPQTKGGAALGSASLYSNNLLIWKLDQKKAARPTPSP